MKEEEVIDSSCKANLYTIKYTDKVTLNDISLFKKRFGVEKKIYKIFNSLNKSNQTYLTLRNMIDDFTEKDAIWSSRTARIIDRTGYTMFLMQIEKGFKLLDKNNDGKIYFDTYRNFLIKDHSCDTLLLPSFE